MNAGQMKNAGTAWVASRLLLSAIVMPADSREERIDPAEIDRFSNTGLGEPETMRALAAAFCEMDHDDPADRFLASIDEILAKTLSATLPVPSIGVDTLKRAHGHFSSRNWSIVLNEDLIEGKSDSKEGLLDVLDTLAHELRHAEQFYAAAKYEAGIHRISFYDFLPEAIRKRAKHDKKIDGSKETEFGEFILDVHLNDELREKKKYINTIIDNPETPSDDYKYYVNVVNTKLPLERDATAIGRALQGAMEACLQPR
ncbi:MAG: hypothetical protein ACR2RA_24860 [Geminicoccaceae bacterium]